MHDANAFPTQARFLSSLFSETYAHRSVQGTNSNNTQSLTVTHTHIAVTLTVTRFEND